MSSNNGSVMVKGKSFLLAGEAIKVGDKIRSAKLAKNDLSEVDISSYAGDILIVSSVPSLDTPVCDTETRKFNKAAGSFGSDAKVLTISMDLPFAQARWCGAAGIDHVKTLSDYRYASFGMSYGLLIKDIKLLARCVMVIDKEGTVVHKELVRETSSEPNYDAAISAVKNLL